MSLRLSLPCVVVHGRAKLMPTSRPQPLASSVRLAVARPRCCEPSPGLTDTQTATVAVCGSPFQDTTTWVPPEQRHLGVVFQEQHHFRTLMSLANYNFQRTGGHLTAMPSPATSSFHCLD